MNKHELVEMMTSDIPTFAGQLTTLLVQHQLDTYSSIPREILLTMANAALTAFIQDMLTDPAHYFNDYWSSVAPQRAEAGAKIDDIFTAIFVSVEMLNDFVAQHCSDNQQLYSWWLRRGYEISHQSMLAISQLFAAARERIINTQNARLRELYTPIIPLYNGILASPLVGAIDAYRAGQVMESLLTGISQQQADVVIIDITGVPMVDTDVANYLLMATRAARLLGANIILVGISAEIAQTIVQLGADLSGITTRANLQAGIEYALAMRGLEIAPCKA